MHYFYNAINYSITMDNDTTQKVKRNSAGVILCSLLSAASCIILLGLGFAYIPKGNAILQTCEITNITYPTEIPSELNEISSNFAMCDCGRNCFSDLGYCVKVYVSVLGENTTSLMGSVVESDPTGHCTFEEGNCFDGESLSDRILALQTANDIAAPFIDIMDTNGTIDCYIVGNNIFYENDVVSHITTMSIVGGLSVFTIIFAIYFYRLE